MDDVFEKLMDLPTTIPSFTVRDPEGDFTVIFNSRLSRERLEKAADHELDHLREKDHEKTGSVDRIEAYAHKLGGKKK